MSLPSGPALQYSAATQCFLQACGKPLCSTPLRAISHRSVLLSFHTCAAVPSRTTAHNYTAMKWLARILQAVSTAARLYIRSDKSTSPLFDLPVTVEQHFTSCLIH
eukprot:GHRR01029843.1.p3 GENE.GHRR01029843.1~~GHRR01029843.1.p3  ORF type:complete len:106 (+),score=27.42 GHRR01029843.1:259-576(+)